MALLPMLFRPKIPLSPAECSSFRASPAPGGFSPHPQSAGALSQHTHMHTHTHTHTHLLEDCSLTAPWGTLPWFVETQRLRLGGRPTPREGGGTGHGGARWEARGLYGHPVRPHHSLQPDSFGHIPGEQQATCRWSLPPGLVPLSLGGTQPGPGPAGNWHLSPPACSAPSNPSSWGQNPQRKGRGGFRGSH